MKQRYERPVIQKLDAGIPNKFGTKTEYYPITNIDGVLVDDLVKDFGSPLFVISEKKIRDTYRRAKKAFTTRYPKVQFAWSYKTNYLSAVCNIFHQEGSWAEVVSGFEYEKAIKNGVEGSKIIFNGPDKSKEDLVRAIDNQSLIHIDHLDEFYTIVEIAESSKNHPKVAIRVNMDTGIYPMWDRFGFNYENGQAWDIMNKIMNNKKIDLVGLHCHIGTFMLSPNAYSIAANKLSILLTELENKYKHRLKYIDLGGGFPSQNTLKGSFMPGVDSNPVIEDFAEAITSTLLNFNFNNNELPTLILETGRALIDESGFLISSVIANKRSSLGRRLSVIDAGVNLLFTSFWYDHKITPAQPFTHYSEPTTLYGPLCMNIDIIRENIELPLLNKNDKVIIHNVGAYCMTQWMQFITYRPNVVLIDLNSKPHLICKAENIDSFLIKESIPQHIKEFEL